MSRNQQALEVFRQGPAIMAEALRGAGGDELSVAPEGKWNIRQIVRHVADTEIVVGMRLRQIMAEDSPTLIPFDHDAWAVRLGYDQADPFDSLERFRCLREDTQRLLEQMSEEDFERPGVHPDRGTKTLVEWVEFFGNHVQTHAGQIRALRVKSATA